MGAWDGSMLVFRPEIRPVTTGAVVSPLSVMRQRAYVFNIKEVYIKTTVKGRVKFSKGSLNQTFS